MKRAVGSSAGQRPATPELIRDALGSIPPDIDREAWVRVAMAIKAEFPDETGFGLFDDWSQLGSSYSTTSARDTWRSIKKTGGGVQVGTLFGMAKDHGWRFPEDVGTPTPPTPQALAEQARLAAEREQRRLDDEAQFRAKSQQAQSWSSQCWADALAVGHSPYLERKGVHAHGVRYLPDGTLVVPMRNADGVVCNVQRIAPRKPTEQELADGWREKRFVKNAPKVGLWHQLGDLPKADEPGVVLVGTGYATCATLFEATGYTVAVAFDDSNLPHVARELRKLLPLALLLMCGDDDHETEAAQIAKTGKGVNSGRKFAAQAARAVVVEGQALAGCVFPEPLPPGGSDFNDLAQHLGAVSGLSAVRALVDAAVANPQIPKPKRSSTGKAGKDDDAPAAPGAPDGTDGADDGPQHVPPPQVTPGYDPFTLQHSLGGVGGGVFHVVRDKEGNEKKPVWLCAPLTVSAYTRTDDGNGWGYLLEFCDRDGRAKQWAMPAALLGGDGSEWASKLRDMGLPMTTGTTARNALARYIETRQPPGRVICTDRVGWHPGGVYVLPSGSIGGEAADTAEPDDAPPRRYVFQSEAGIEDTFRRAGTLQAWQASVAELCQGNTRLMFALCCALAGPLMRPAGIESGGFHFRGASSVGKTTALKVAASVWGRPSFMQRWRTTDNALEATAVQHCDCTLILDEIGQVDGRVVGDCAYLLANEQEKSRNTRSGMNRKRRTWRLLFISSGEKSLADHMLEAGRRVMAGQEVRMVDIPLDAGRGMGGVEELHGHDGPAALADAVTAAAARSYGMAGRAWLEWLAGRFGSLAGEIAPLIEQFRSQMVPESASEQVRRVGTRFALAAAAGELAIRAGVLPWAAGAAADSATSCFNAWLMARGHVENFELAAMLRQVRAYLETNGDALFTYTHRAMDDHRPNTPLRAGFKRLVNKEGVPLKIDNDASQLERRIENNEKAHALTEFMVLPEAFKTQMCKGFEASVVAALLRERGHLICEKDRLMSKQRLPGLGKVPIYHIKPSVFEDALG